MAIETIINVGDRYGFFTVIKEYFGEKSPKGLTIRRIECKCDCGTTKIVRLASLREGTTVSCGCFHRSNTALLASERMGTHRKSNSKIYYIWSSMIQRCHNKSNKSYSRYGEKGIRVCNEWRESFEEFYKYIGDKKDGMTLDRINSNGNYEPGNVRWATYKQQARNTKRSVYVMYKKKKYLMIELAEILGIDYEHFRHSVYYGRSLATSLGVTRV